MDESELTKEELEERRRRSKLTAVLLLVGAMTGGVLVIMGYLNYLNGLKEKSAEQRKLPIIARLSDNYRATERSGKDVDLMELRGKVLLAGHVYTRCPRGCAGLAVIMKQIQERYGDDPNLHLLSFSVDPENDGPEQLAEFADLHGIEGDNWWFLTDQKQPKELQKYLVSQFRFRPTLPIAPEDRLNEFDLWAHDLRIALVDHEGHVRFHYLVLDVEHGEAQVDALIEDVGLLLGEVGEGRRVGMSPSVFYGIVGLAAVFVVGMFLFREKQKKAN